MDFCSGRMKSVIVVYGENPVLLEVAMPARCSPSYKVKVSKIQTVDLLKYS